MFLWPGIADRQNMPLLGYIKPGHTFNMGERVMDPHTSSTPELGTAIDQLYDLYGWPIVSLELTPPYSADSPKREPFTASPWPGAILSCIKWMRYLRENAQNTTLWGANGSIDPNRILIMGSSSGHTLAMLLACIPPEALGLMFGRTHLGALPYVVDHRPNAVAGWIGQIDWTQFALDPDETTGAFRFDVMQYFHGLNGSLTNTALEQALKRSASPWWWKNHLRPDGTKFWSSWGQRPSSGPGRNLTPELWSPGTIQNVEPRAFYDPHHYFQAKPWDDALKLLGVSSRTIWGGADDNAAGFNNDAIPDGAADLVQWVQRSLRWPVVQASV